MRHETFVEQLSECYYSDFIVQEASHNCYAHYGYLISKYPFNYHNDIIVENTIDDETASFLGSKYEMRCIREDIISYLVHFGPSSLISHQEEVI